MSDFLYGIDKGIFVLVNQVLSTRVGDTLWPYLTDYIKFLPVRIFLAIVWVLLLVRGGTRGRTVALLLIPILLIGDQLSSSIVKGLVNRVRPCHLINGVPVVPELHLLVDCGSGKSFPSSHAVNNFAVATLLTFYYRRWAWAFFAFASMVAVSRVAVGVHYPSDVLGGAVIGTLVALAVIWVYHVIQRMVLQRRTATVERKETP